MKVYQIRSSTGGELGKIEADSHHEAAVHHGSKTFVSLDVMTDRMTGTPDSDGYFWARWMGTDRYIGQPFKVEEATGE